MSTRHASVKGPYPFVSAEGSPPEGFLDIYLIIQGGPTTTEPSQGYSDRVTFLSSASPMGDVTRFTFIAVINEPDGSAANLWEIYFEVPNENQPGLIGEVKDTGETDSQGTIVFNSSYIPASSSFSGEPIVEPSRVEFHIEQVNSVNYYNGGTLVRSASDTIALEDGYNTEVSFDPVKGVSFKAGAGLGKGRSPTLEGPGSSGVLDDFEYISVVNGIAPVGGNINISVSPGLAVTNVEPGKIEIRNRQ